MNYQILIGTQLVVSNEFNSLTQNRVYYFLARTSQVRLVWFEDREPKRVGKKLRADSPLPKVHIMDVSGDIFDYGLDQGFISVKPCQDELPHWLVPEDISPESKNAGSNIIFDKQEERVKRKIQTIAPLVESAQSILSLENPFKYLNHYAKLSCPELNTSRLRTEFFSYILFRRDERVLRYRVGRIGLWDRVNHKGGKPGIKSLGVSKNFLAKSTDIDVINDIKVGWQRWGKFGSTVSEIHQKVCAYLWEAETLENSRGVKVAIRPDGRPVLSEQQFRRRLHKIIGYEQVKTTLRGRAFWREEKASSTGRFSEDLCNVGERVESDGYWVKEKVLAPDGVSILPGLVVIRVKCVLSGMLLGIGFSLGGESAEAYRMAQFCMAIPKSLFGKYFGVEISDERWPSVGISDNLVFDRGAGSSIKAEASEPIGKAAMREMPPTGFGQGKAAIESSHPRKPKTRDRQAYRATSLNLIDLMRKEIERTIDQVDSADMSSRITPSMLAYVDRATPLAIFSALSERGRTCLRPISFEDAVRSFLSPVSLQVKADGVYHMYQRYTSADFALTGLMSIAATTGKQIEVTGYSMEMSLRYLFVEWKGKIIEVAAVLAIREDDEQLFISLEEMKLADQLLREMKSDLRVHASATKVEGLQRFISNAGISPEKYIVKQGAPKRKSKNLSSESRLIKEALTHRRSSK
ncbi:hypothetical protein [Comamonas testosteroni]|uniref:hypothetical protein n=1 Tax=Comamonas testosteroni TaxID=285 RepID=UPI00391CD798